MKAMAVNPAREKSAESTGKASPARGGESNRVVHAALCEALPACQASAAHADRRWLQEQLRSWLQHHGLLDFAEVRRTLAVALIPQQAAACFPGCRTQDDALLCCAWLAWAQSFDDRFDSPPLSNIPEQAEWGIAPCLEVTAAARTGKFPLTATEPFSAALADLLRWACQPMGAAWREYLFTELDTWLRAYVAETSHRARRHVLAPADLIAHKRRCMADTINCVLIDRVGSGELSPLARDIMRPVTDVGADILGAVNDLASLAREREMGDVHNLVLSFTHHQAVSEDSAIEAVRHLVADWAGELRRLATTLPADPAVVAERETVSQWAAYRSAFVRGYHDWTLETRRYQAGPVFQAGA
jgi:hypothetical protein